ncbi:uncharacterized protein LOC143673867 isoform X1 [Tamandua tetradactyla]|uniref:uncharacterized protein LOC143673867 isoform X1 n=1 Tax=Tamandua tetradactyla TaxID=48850 RepID=UPI004053EE3A
MCCSGSVPNCPADFAPLPPSASGKARAPRWGHGEAAGSGDPKVRFMYPPPPGHDSFRTPRPGRRGGEMTCVYPRHRRRGSPHWRERTWWPVSLGWAEAVKVQGSGEQGQSPSSAQLQNRRCPGWGGGSWSDALCKERPWPRESICPKVLSGQWQKGHGPEEDQVETGDGWHVPSLMEYSPHGLKQHPSLLGLRVGGWTLKGCSGWPSPAIVLRTLRPRGSCWDQPPLAPTLPSGLAISLPQMLFLLWFLPRH